MTRRSALILSALIALGSPATAEPDPGAYLAARQAGISGDFAAAARFFPLALAQDPSDPVLRENTLTSFIALGQFDKALPIAEQIVESGQESQMANLVLLSDDVAREDWDALFADLETGREVGPLLDALVQAWAFVGKGQMDNALERFDELAETPAMRSFGLLHKAFALSLVGDLEGADAILSRPPAEGVLPTRGSVTTHIEVLARLGETERALTLMENAFAGASDPMLDALRETLASGDLPDQFTVGSAREGVAYAMLGLADVLQGEANPEYLLMYARAAGHVNPDRAGAHITAAQLLTELGQHDLAAQTFARVGTDDPQFYTSELGRADALRSAGNTDGAIEVLTQLSRSHGELAIVHATMGDHYRRIPDYENANAAYSRALDLYSDEDPVLWWVTYSRGITYERMGQWPEAEADFRRALELSPGQPSVLNYLGYSMVEMGINLDEALAMIEEAAAERPDNGAIIDSLGWVLFKLGRYQEAVTHMERAVELEPVDPIVTDHLGDVYWMVGREEEARFQWHRALSFDPEEDEAVRIRRKLEVGLLAVLEEEGVDLSDLAYDRQ